MSQSISERVIERNWSDPISVAVALIIGFGNKKSRLSADKEWPIKSIAQLEDNSTNGLLERMQCNLHSTVEPTFGLRVFVTAMALIYYCFRSPMQSQGRKCSTVRASLASHCFLPSSGQSLPIIQSIYLLILLLSANLVKKQVSNIGSTFIILPKVPLHYYH